MNSHDLWRSALQHSAILAPMLTTTDIPFRMICKRFGAALATTEMVSAKGIIDRSPESYRYAVIDRAERPVAIQIITSSAENVVRAIHELLPLDPDVFDINAGCPSERVCEAGAGADLLDNLQALGAVVRAAAKASNVPVSVKVRSRGLAQTNNLRAIVKTVEDSGAAFVTIHARGRGAKYSAGADWTDIATAKELAGIPVVGNGDVFSSADAHSMMAQTGCDAVMVARGSLGTPWIFRDIKLGRNAGITEFAPDHTELHDIVRQHLAALKREFGIILALPRMRKHLLWYIRWYSDFEQSRKQIFARDDVEYLMDTVDEFFSVPRLRIEPDSREFKTIEERFRRKVLFWTIPSESALQSR